MYVYTTTVGRSFIRLYPARQHAGPLEISIRHEAKWRISHGYRIIELQELEKDKQAQEFPRAG